uniref:Uncharacterized protein n=1 Tax=Strigamia maritima TaxID=126957 RepID=T1J9A2_STRMM
MKTLKEMQNTLKDNTTSQLETFQRAVNESNEKLITFLQVTTNAISQVTAQNLTAFSKTINEQNSQLDELKGTIIIQNLQLSEFNETINEQNSQLFQYNETIHEQNDLMNKLNETINGQYMNTLLVISEQKNQYVTIFDEIISDLAKFDQRVKKLEVTVHKMKQEPKKPGGQETKPGQEPERQHRA